MIKITGAGIPYQGTLLAVGQSLTLDAVTEARMVATGNAEYLSEISELYFDKQTESFKTTAPNDGGVFVTATTNPLTGGIEGLVGPDGKQLIGFSSPPDAILAKHGRVLQRLNATNQTVGVTTVTHVLSNERPRFAAYTRKATITSASLSELRFPGLSISTDADDQAFSIDIYIEQIFDNFLGAGANSYLAINVSNATPLASNYSQWLFDATCLRQGWNTLKCRAADSVGVAHSGNLPYGVSRSVTGTGVDFALPIQYIAMQFTRMNGFVVHIDDIRQPARAKPVLVIGFDANEETIETLVAPLFEQHGIESYTTFTHVYEEVSANSAAWERMIRLQKNYGWDILHHTWSHGATEVGRNTSVNLSRVSNVVTALFASAHGIPLLTQFKGCIATATTADLNGIFDMTAPTTTTVTYTAAGANVAGPEAAKIRTMLSEVLGTDTAENRRILKREIQSLADVMRASGLHRQSGAMAYPNNSVPHIDMVNDILPAAGVYLARGSRNGYCSVNELGIDNPLHVGSFPLESATSGYTKLSVIKAKIQGAIDRGEHLWIYGHFIQLAADAGGTVDLEYPPGQGGNPAPPAGALSGGGGWWYYEALKDVIDTVVAPAIANGTLTVMRPSKLRKFMGLGT